MKLKKNLETFGFVEEFFCYFGWLWGHRRFHLGSFYENLGFTVAFIILSFQCIVKDYFLPLRSVQTGFEMGCCRFWVEHDVALNFYNFYINNIVQMSEKKCRTSNFPFRGSWKLFSIENLQFFQQKIKRIHWKSLMFQSISQNRKIVIFIFQLSERNDGILIKKNPKDILSEANIHNYLWKLSASLLLV